MSASQETPRPPATPEFGAVTPDGPSHVYPSGGGARVTKLSFGRFDNNVYVIRSGDEAIVIDGSAGPDRIAPELDGARAVAIVLTHDHPDHTQNLAALRDALGCPVYANPADRWPVETVPLNDGDVVRAGDAELRALHTPGHTPGSTSLLTGSFLFSGDALFPGGPGDTGGDAARFARAMDSVERLLELDEDVRVCPGHGLDTTVGRERPYAQAWRARGW
jgi:glyoxylase-like metal-dependent hydrolase (beta-lactamase superfamily II)